MRREKSARQLRIRREGVVFSLSLSLSLLSLSGGKNAKNKNAKMRPN
jgi:hypothetical protein